MTKRLATASLVVFFAQAEVGWTCATYPEDAHVLGVIEQLSDNDICRALTSGFGDPIDCTSGHYSNNYLSINVAPIDRDEGFARVSFKIVAPSEKLSGIIGGRGYESHVFEGLLFLGLDCRPKYWITPHEPRYIKSAWDIASDPGNPNWKLYSDGDRITEVREKVQKWFIRVFERGR